jgi:hypothetical protein
VPCPILFLFKLLHLFEAIEKFFKHLSITFYTLHFIFKFLALAVLCQEKLPFCGITYGKNLLLLCFWLIAKYLDLFLFDHGQDTLFDITDALTGLLLQFSVLYQVTQLRIYFEMAREQISREGFPTCMLSMLIRVKVLFKLLKLIIKVACCNFLRWLTLDH